jgi:hypothetical protein
MGNLRARRRRIELGYETPVSSVPRLRSPVEVEREAKFDAKQQAIIAASLDFLYEAGENALRQQTRRVLALKSKPCPNPPTSSSPTSA